jgi:tetratricopeptide (TPR) repeat protein
LAWQLAARVLDQMSDAALSDLGRAEILADRALAAFPRTALAHYAKAQVLRAQQRFEEAISHYETVVAFNRNWVHAIATLGYCKFITGSIEEAIPAQERAIRLSPRDPKIWQYYYWIGQVHLLQSRTDEAIFWFEKARGANPEHPLPHAYLSSAYALKGESGRANAELALARRLNSDGRYGSFARLRVVAPFGVPKIRALFEATYLLGLRKAGMPDQ